MSGTDEHGKYAIELSRPGSYRVQFLACGDDHRYAGEWWDNQKTAATAKTIDVSAGEVVRHIDASLARGDTSTISGKVVNMNGAAMTSACVIAFVPDKFALFGMVQPDGTYSIPDVPSGTYALAFLGCDGGDPRPTVADPQSPTVSYPGVWWKNALVSIDQGSPDPIEQGATFVTVEPGKHLTGYDMCFGCTAIRITKITPGDGSLTVAFETTGILPAGVQSMAVNPAAAGYTYTVTCTSPTGVTGTATGTSSPITVTGLTPGADYTCRVTASDGSVTVAGSEASGVVQSTPVPATASPSGEVPVPVTLPSTGPTSPAVGAQSGSSMARTGAESGVIASLGALALAMGLAFVIAGRRRRSGASV